MDIEFENENLDAIIHAIGEAIEANEQREGILDPERLRQMASAYRLMTEIGKEINAKVTYSLNEPYKSMGSISIEADSLEFTDVPKMMAAISTCSNVEVYPLANENIRMTLTFHGLVKSL